MWLQKPKMILTRAQVEAYLHFRGLLEGCPFSSLGAPRGAGLGVPCLARVCSGRTQRLPPLFPGGQESRSSLTRWNPRALEHRGAVLSLARK